MMTENDLGCKYLTLSGFFDFFCRCLSGIFLTISSMFLIRSEPTVSVICICTKCCSMRAQIFLGWQNHMQSAREVGLQLWIWQNMQCWQFVTCAIHNSASRDWWTMSTYWHHCVGRTVSAESGASTSCIWAGGHDTAPEEGEPRPSWCQDLSK